MISFKRIGFSALAALSLVGPGVASAAPVQWSVSYVNPAFFTLAGSFVYDAATNTFSAINVTAIEGFPYFGVTAPAYTLVDPTEGNSASRFTFWDSLAADRTGAKFITFNLFARLTDAGGTIGLPASAGRTVQPIRCDNADCSFTTSLGIPPTSNGSLTGVPLRAVPEPTTLALLGLGLAGIAAARRRAV